MTRDGTTRIVCSFLVMLALFEVLYLLFDQSEAVVTFSQATAHLTGLILSVLGETVRVDDASLYSPVLNMKIVSECTSITPTMVFIAAILSFPSSLSAKLNGLILGICALFLINLVRVVSLYYVGAHTPGHLEFVHVVVWQTVMVLLAIGLWSLWASRQVEPRHG